MAGAVPGEPRAERKGYRPGWRTRLLEGPNADFLFLANRDSEIGQVLPGAVDAAHAVHTAETRAPHYPGDSHGARAVHEQGSAVLEVPCHRRRCARQVRLGAELLAGAGP